MLPKINVTSTYRKNIRLTKTKITKLTSPTTIYNINSTQTKGFPTESPKHNASYNQSKRSRIFNASTKINTTSTSNFNDNLYYYPPHNRKFSYVDNLSSEVVLLYGDFNFNKAPSLRQNFSGIRKIIKDHKTNKIKYLDNLFSMSMYGNKISQRFSGDNKNTELTNQVNTNTKISRNNSCGELSSNNKIKIKNIKNTQYKNNENKIYIQNKATSPKETNNNNDEKFKSNNNLPSTTNQETVKLPELSKTEEKNKITRENNIFHRSNSFITDLNNRKLIFDINECIFESNRNIKNVCNFAKKLFHIKLYQGFQRKTIDNFIYDNFHKLEKYINNVESNFSKYTEVCKIYNHEFFNYMIFLKSKIIEMENGTKSLIMKQTKLEFEIDDLINANIITQRKLEKLIDMRNFIYKVRHKDETIPNIYSTFYIENKRYLLAKLFIKLFKNFNNLSIEKYLQNIPLEIPDLNSFHPSEFIVENNPPLLMKIDNNISNSNKSKKNHKNIKRESNIDHKNYFGSYEEFIRIIKYLENQNISLLEENMRRNGYIEKYKKTLENCIVYEDIEFEEKLKQNIEIKEKELEVVKNKNLMLLQKFKNIYNMLFKGDLFIKAKKTSKKDDEQKSSFQDLTYFQTINYNFLIKKAKYPGLIFFRKLLKSYLDFLKINTDETIYNRTHPDYLEEIINFALNAEQNEKFTYFLNRYVLQILQLYEYICDYTYKKYQIYKLNEKNLVIMKKQKEIILDKRKLDNARTLRKLIDKKRYNANMQLIEKWSMPTKYREKRNYVGTYCRDLIRAKSKDVLLIKKKVVKKKYDIDNDLDELLHYD